jgi:hypothetical protein
VVCCHAVAYHGFGRCPSAQSGSAATKRGLVHHAGAGLSVSVRARGNALFRDQLHEPTTPARSLPIGPRHPNLPDSVSLSIDRRSGGPDYFSWSERVYAGHLDAAAHLRQAKLGEVDCVAGPAILEYSVALLGDAQSASRLHLSTPVDLRSLANQGNGG